MDSASLVEEGLEFLWFDIPTPGLREEETLYKFLLELLLEFILGRFELWKSENVKFFSRDEFGFNWLSFSGWLPEPLLGFDPVHWEKPVVWGGWIIIGDLF